MNNLAELSRRDIPAEREAWRTFIAELSKKYPPDWWCHFTLANDMYPHVADRIFRNWCSFLRMNTYARQELRHGQNLVVIRATEFTGRGKNTPHYHALISNGVRDLDIEEWERRACQEMGLAVFRKYDPAKGALAYLLKGLRAGSEMDVPFFPKPDVPPINVMRG